MRNIVNPQQTRLFDPFDNVLTEKTRKRLLDGWQGAFRHVILELMPVDAIGGHLSSTMGRPSKELYSIAGLLLIKEFKNWTNDEALESYSFNMATHYALNLEPVTHDIGMRTLERYINLFEEDATAKATMDEITVKLIDLLDIKIDQQRLDSTHIFSDMANFGRTRLMGVDLVGPVPGCPIDDGEQLTIADFNIDEESEKVICCPAGHAPQSSEHNSDTGKTKTLMLESTCGQCEFRGQCPVKKTRDDYQLGHTAKDRRIAARRKEQATEVFIDRYKIRGGIEGTNSGLKQKTGLGRLRVRGRPAVYHAIYLRIAG